MSLREAIKEQMSKEITQSTVDKDKRYVGKIIHISDKGWGFITTPDLKYVRIFFHWQALKQGVSFPNLKKGQLVEFNVIEYPDKGARAIKIGLVNEE
jgi:cold shock CspA family protein